MTVGGCRVSCWGDENVLDGESGEGCITLNILQNH